MISKRELQQAENGARKRAFAFAEFVFDAEDKILWRAGSLVGLPPKTCELLAVFIENAGQLLTKEDLMSAVWADTFVEEANLSHHIAVLRKSLGEEKDGKKFIQTIPRKGYRFLAPVSEISDRSDAEAEIIIEEYTRAQIIEETEIETDPIAAEDERDRVGKSKEPLLGTRKTNRRAVVALGAFGLLLAAAAVFAWRLWSPQQARPAFFDEDSRSRWRVASVIEGKSRKAGNISNVSFASGGNYIAFNRSAGGKSTVFVKQIGGGEAVRVTDGKWLDYSPVWSADGQRVAFISNRDDFIGVWAVPSLGGTPVLLRRLAVSPQLPVRLLKWSRDGNRIYYIANFRVYVQDLTDAQAEPVLLFEKGEEFGSAGDFAISPDESRMAFYAERGGEIQLYTRPLTGGEMRPVTSGAGKKRHPAWFANGRQLVFSSDASGRFQIYALDLESGETRQLTLDAMENAEPMVGADDRSILFHATRDEANVYSYALESRVETPLTSGTGLQIFPSVAPDGQSVAFQTSASATAVYESDLKILALDGSEQTLEIARRGFNPQWSPDGSALAFMRNSGATANLWKASASGQNETQLTKDGIHPTNFTFAPYDITHVNFEWSPDGKKIVYASFKSGAANVWTIDAADGTEKKWTNYAGEATAVSGYRWSPDGQKIVFFAQMKPPDEKSLRSFRVCWTDGERTETIYETTAPIRILGWSRAGHEVFVAERETNAETKEKSVLLVKLPIVGDAKPQRIADLRRTDFDKPRLSPDAQSFIFTAFDEQGESENLYMLSAEGGAPQRLTDNRDPNVYYSGVTFATDGKFVFYSKQSSGDAYALLTISE